MLAAQHAATSSELTAATSIPATGPPGQATSAAVMAGYGALQAAARVLATRVQATGTKLATAGTNFTAVDAESAQRIAAVDPSTVL